MEEGDVEEKDESERQKMRKASKWRTRRIRMRIKNRRSGKTRKKCIETVSKYMCR